MRWFVAILAIAIGVAGVVAGGADDSPGVQLLGVPLIIGSVVLREDGPAPQVARAKWSSPAGFVGGGPGGPLLQPPGAAPTAC